MKINFKELTGPEIFSFIERLGQKPFRARQIINWIYKKFAVSFDEMTDLSKDFREKLKEKAYISDVTLLQRQVSEDGTQKFLFELEDGETIESVLIPANKGAGRFTLCISSQVGCAMGCKFCITGKIGLKRNLKAHEIIDQVTAVGRLIGQSPAVLPITNIVFMGMGEPFNNFNEVAHALTKLIDLMGFSRRKITVSTCGIIPGIQKLAGKGPIVNLAISLNATTDEVRDRIMPINKKYPLKNLIRACREFPLPPRRRITFEYILLDKINDTKEDALRLVKLLGGIKAKVNLIPYNPAVDAALLKPSNHFKRSSDESILEFQKILLKAGIAAIIRKSMGGDISAACGQLKAKYL